MACLILTVVMSKAQIPASLAAKLDSLGSGSNVESHFAGVYVWATRAADVYIATLPDTPKMLMNRVQQDFAALFFKGIEDSRLNQPNPVWSGYFKAQNLTPLQYKLMGTNTHINGDSWRVLVDGFTAKELRIVAPYYHHCTEELHSVLDSLHHYAMQNSRRMKTLHILTLGLDKPIAKGMLRRWRYLQFEIGEACVNQSAHCDRLKRKAEHRRVRMERRAVRLVR